MPLRLHISGTMLVALLGSLAIDGLSQSVEFTKLRKELLLMQERDQEFRGKGNYEEPSPDNENATRLQEIIEEIGYPTIAKVGPDGSNAAWLIVQHADHDRDFQLRVLELLHPLALSGEVDPRNFAYLYDRTHRPQRFGTQGSCVGKTWEPRELENPTDVDSLRASFDLEPLEKYAKAVSELACQD